MAKSKSKVKINNKPVTVKDLVVTSRQILRGWTNSAPSSAKLWGIYPLQMIPKQEKTDEWIRWNLDWFEREGFDSINKKWKAVSKDYNMAEGILDPSDYGLSSDNEFNYVVSTIQENEEGNVPLMFFPLVPTIVNLFVGEYMKKDTRLIVKAVDEYSVNQQQEKKKELVVQYLLQKTAEDLKEKYGESQDAKEKIDYALKIKEVELSFKKYASIAEQWANHMIKWDNTRFNIKELQTISFRDVIVSDETFFHVRTLDDDILPEVWNPKTLFYHLPPDKLWLSQSTFLGRQMYMPLNDILVNYSHLMENLELAELEANQGNGIVSSDQHLVNLLAGTNMGDNSKWTDFSQKYPNNITDSTMENHLLQDSVNKYLDTWATTGKKNRINLDDALKHNMFRVTEVYWRSYAREFICTSVDELGIKTTNIVNEDYVVTNEPKYDNSLTKVNSKDNLISGEHLDAYWKTEIRFGVKIARNPMGYYDSNLNSINNGIYLGGKPIETPIDTIPGEGMALSDRNTDKMSLVRKMSPFQIGFNIVNNQNIDMLGNAIANGKVVMIDQNFIPKKSIDGEWGKNALNKWLEIIRNNNIALMDGSPVNNPSGTGFSHFQVLDFSNSDDIRRNIELGTYFKDQAFSTIGVNPQRIGSIYASESATGVQTAQSNSYAQTEYMFEKHINQLMPRVRNLMLNIEQYMASTKDMVKVAYTNSEEENILFEVEGKELILPNLKLYAYSTADVKALVEKMQNVAMQINTAGAEMSDYMEIMTTDSPSLIIENLKKGEQQRRENMEAQRKHEQELEQQRQEQREKELQREEDLKKYLQEKDLETKRYIAEINELGGIQTDANANKELDSLENIKEYQKQNNFEAKLKSDETKAMTANELKRRELDLKEKEMLSRNNIENTRLQIARENKNKYDKK